MSLPKVEFSEEPNPPTQPEGAGGVDLVTQDATPQVFVWPTEEPLPHEADPKHVYDTTAHPVGDYRGEPHPWQSTQR